MRFILLVSAVLFQTAIKSQYGEIDTDFGNDGFVEISLGIGANSRILDTKLDNQQRIVSVGSRNNGLYTELYVLRLMPDGIVDDYFGNQGEVTLNTWVTNTYGTCLVIDSQGRIVVAGHYNHQPYQEIFVTRFLSDGSVDSSFGNDGVLSVGIGNNNAYCHDLALDSNENIVLAGHVNFNNLGEDFFVIRLDSEGEFDENFGIAGVVGNVNDVSSGSNANIVIQEDDKIIVSGTGGIAGTPHFCLIRLNIDGSLDTTFGTEGILTTYLGGEYNSPYALLLKPDGKILTAGLSGYWQSLDLAMVQYSNTGVLDNEFGNIGTLLLHVNGGMELVTDLILQPDDKLVASVATVGPDGTYDYFVIRFYSDGILDETFGIGGFVNIAFPNNDARPEAVELQSDGKIVVAGYSQTVTSNYTAIVRLESGLPVGTQEFEADNNMILFPNPSEEFLRIVNPDAQVLEVRFLDLQGKSHLGIQLSDDNLHWDISGLSSGIYIVQICTVKGTKKCRLFVD